MDSKAPRRDRLNGQVLVGVILLMMLLLIIVPAMVQWIQQDTRASVKEQKSTTAYNLAEAAIDRGMWKLKSSTGTWDNAVNSVVLAGYDFDVTYTDVAGGTYRIRFSSGVLNGAAVVTVWGEGRDSLQRETRSLQVVYQNTSVPGAIIAGGTLVQAGSAIVHWGPILAMNNITLSGSSLTRHYPRKLSKQVVLPYDTNGVTPTNTDNLEWWSDYDVPDLPQFDFTALRSSAAATNTLNCNGTYNATNQQVPCGSVCTACDVTNIDMDNRYNSNYVWYWDNDVTMHGVGVKGTVIVRGNLSTAGGDSYGPHSPTTFDVNMTVPPEAYLEYQALDTASVNQYPGDIGFQNTTNSYILGACGTSCEGSASGDDLGFYGFVYVGGNVDFQGDTDIYGAVWVVGNWAAAGNNLLFYDANLSVPTLNVVLVRRSWKEVTPSTAAWL